MKRKQKINEKQLQQLLQRNTPPEPEAGKRRAVISRLNADAENMDYLEQESFAEKILTMGSYISPRVWIIQAAFPVFFFFYARQEESAVLPLLCMLAPGLTLLLLWELSKTFGNNMWELEAACRYNLPQLFFRRLVLLSGGDLIILIASLAVFQMAGGPLWQFALYALLPFFLLSALCLWVLQRFGRRCLPAGAGAAVLLLEALWLPFSQLLLGAGQVIGEAAMKKLVLCFTLLALLLFAGSAAGLCTKKYYGNTGKEFNYGA